MTIYFTDDRYFIGIWFVGHDANKPIEDRMDWLATAYREIDGDLWHILYRFRYHDDADPWSGDKKSWYETRGPVKTATMSEAQTEEKVHEAVAEMAALVADHNRAKVFYTDIRGNGTTALEKVRGAPWVHTREATEEESEEHQRNTKRKTKAERRGRR